MIVTRREKENEGKQTSLCEKDKGEKIERGGEGESRR